MFAGDFAPRDFALAHGQLLPIAQNSALFSILGTQFGGDGESTFALPDLRGRVPIGTGQGPGLSDYEIGDSGGFASTTLTVNQIPSHDHSVVGSTDSSATGGGQQFDNRQPYLALTPVVSTVGAFPSSNLSSDGLRGSVDWFAGNFAPRRLRTSRWQLIVDCRKPSALSPYTASNFGGDGPNDLRASRSSRSDGGACRWQRRSRFGTGYHRPKRRNGIRHAR